MTSTSESALERHLGTVLFAVSLILYLATTTRYPVPGESTWLIAGHCGLSGLPPVTHSLWGNLVWLVKLTAFGPLAAKANLVSALCAAGAVWLFFRVVRDLPVHPDYLKTFPAMRTCAAALGALYLAVSLPLWRAGTRAHYDAFDLLLFLACLWLLQRYARAPGRYGHGALFLFGCMLGVVESPLFLPWLPVPLLLFLIATWVHGNFRLRGLRWFALALAGGALYTLLVAWWFTARPDYLWQDQFKGPLDVALYLWRDKVSYILHIVPRKGWLYVAALSVLPFAVAVLNLRIPPTGLGSVWGAFSYLLVFLAAALLLVNLPWSPWIWERTREVHMVPAALLAAAFGLALAFLVYWLRRREWLATLGWVRGPVVIATGLALGVLLPATALTYYRVQTRAARLYRYVTEGMLDALGPRPWLVTEGLLDHLLQINAYDRRQTLHLINGPQSAYLPYRRLLQARFPTDPRRRGLALYSPRGLLREWLRSDPQVTTQLAVEQSHTLWRDNGFRAVPVGGLYLGFPRGTDEVDAPALYERQAVFWSGLLALLESTPAAATPEEKVVRATVLRQQSRLANEFGFFLEAEGQQALAEKAYRTARDIDAGNLSAYLNEHQIRVDAGDPGAEEMWRQIRRATFREGAAVPIGRLELEYGPVRAPAAAERYRKLYDSSEPQRVPAVVIEGIDRIRQARQEGRPKDALALAQELLKSYDVAEAWNQLGVLGHSLGERELFDRSFQHMRSLNQHWPDLLVLAGRDRFQKKDWRAARALFEEAILARPFDLTALDYLVRLSLVAEDLGSLPMWLDQLLAADPGHPTANYALAHAFFLAGEYGMAEMTLDRSLEYRADPAALANLAWMLQIQGRLDIALKYARQAVKLDPGLAPAWDTLASVLMARGEFAEAEKAITEALRLEPNIIDIQLNQMRLLALTGRAAEARDQAVRLEKSGIPLTPEQQAELARFVGPPPPAP